MSEKKKSSIFFPLLILTSLISNSNLAAAQGHAEKMPPRMDKGAKGTHQAGKGNTDANHAGGITINQKSADSDINTGKKLGIFEVVKTTLDQSPNIKIQKLQVDVARGTERAQSGAFDIVSSASATSAQSLSTSGIPYELGQPGGTITADYNTQTLSAGASKTFRTGVSATLGYSITQTDPRQGNQFIGATTNVSSLTFSLNIPLLKGAGRVSAAAAETAARYNREASVFDFKHLISTTTLGTINAYWDYAAAFQVQKYRSQSRDIIKSWASAESPFKDYLQGFLSEREGKVAEASQQLEQSKVALARAMGIPTHTIEDMGEPNTDEFPLEWDSVLSQFNTDEVRKRWTEIAKNNREDIRAQEFRLRSAETSLDKAKKDVNPTLNLQLGYGTTGFSYGNHFDNFMDSTHEHVRSPSHSAGLVFSYPIGNNTALGSLDAAQANYTINTIRLDETTRSVTLSISENIPAVTGGLKQAIEADKTLKSYIDSNENILDRGGFDQLENVTALITQHDKLDDAAINYIVALRDLAKAIAQARYNVGVLISSTDNLGSEITLEKLTTLP